MKALTDLLEVLKIHDRTISNISGRLDEIEGVVSAFTSKEQDLEESFESMRRYVEKVGKKVEQLVEEVDAIRRVISRYDRKIEKLSKPSGLKELRKKVKRIEKLTKELTESLSEIEIKM